MSLATWVCFVGALQSSVVAAIAERQHPHAWAIGWDTRLFAPAYAVSNHILRIDVKYFDYNLRCNVGSSTPTLTGSSYIRSSVLHTRHGDKIHGPSYCDCF